MKVNPIIPIQNTKKYLDKRKDVWYSKDRKFEEILKKEEQKNDSIRDKQRTI